MGLVVRQRAHCELTLAARASQQPLQCLQLCSECDVGNNRGDGRGDDVATVGSDAVNADSAVQVVDAERIRQRSCAGYLNKLNAASASEPLDFRCAHKLSLRLEHAADDWAADNAQVGDVLNGGYVVGVNVDNGCSQACRHCCNARGSARLPTKGCSCFLTVSMHHRFQCHVSRRDAYAYAQPATCHARMLHASLPRGPDRSYIVRTTI